MTGHCRSGCRGKWEAVIPWKGLSGYEVRSPVPGQAAASEEGWVLQHNTTQ